METGTVKWFDGGRGFGVIGVESGKSRGKDLFVHFSAIQCDGYKTLNEGDSVSFEIETGPKGKPQAALVVVTHGA